MKMKPRVYVPWICSHERYITDSLSVSHVTVQADLTMMRKRLGRELFTGFMAKMADARPQRLIWN